MTSTPLDTSPTARAERLYCRLLCITPRGFREQARPEMLAVFRDGLREAARQGPLARARFWLRTTADLLATARAERRPNLPANLPPDRGLIVETLLKDLRFAARTLLRNPGFSIVVILTLALGIGANTAIFSVVDAILLRPLPLPEPDRLVAVWADYTRLDGPLREWLSYPDYHDIRQLDAVFDEVGVWSGWGPTLTGSGEPEALTGAIVSAGMLDRVLGISPALGRSLSAEDDRPGAAGTVLLSHAFWMRGFSGDPDVVGQSILLNGDSYVVIGVMPADFRPPFLPRADVWSPFREDISQHSGGRGSAAYLSLGRLADGVDLETGRSAVAALAARLEDEYPQSNAGIGFALMPLHDDLVSVASTALWVLLGAVGFVLLMACVNVANLLLAQSTSRRAEFAVRSALGASQRRIVRQLLSESLLLALLGGCMGALLGTIGTRVLTGLAPPGTPRLQEVGVDPRVLAFTAAVTVASALIFGLLPALRSARADLHDRLKEGGRSQDLAAQGRGLRSALVIVQVALALVLLVGAGLLLRTFERLSAVDLGFDVDPVLAVNLNLPAARYGERPEQAAFYAELERRLQRLPGVVSVGAINTLPLSGNDGDANFQIEGRPPMEPGKQRVAWIRRVTAGYLDTMGHRLLSGRGFTAGDDAGAPQVVMINETLANRYFPGEDPVGQRLYFGSPDDPNYRQIVGIVGDIKNFGIAEGARNAIYFPYPQVPVGFMTVVLRADGDPMALASGVRREISELDGLLASSGIDAMRTLVDASLAPERFTTTLMSSFAAAALVLAIVGLYGVVSYGVGLRYHEMGVRVALGAEGRDIGRLVVGGSFALVAAGVAVGLVGAFAVTRLLGGLLFGVEPTDPVTFAAVVAVMLVAGLSAAAVPAARAARVDPIRVLNQD